MHRKAIKIHNQMQKARHVLLVPHQNPDGDALGSVTALIKYFKNQGKKSSAYCASPLSHRYGFLPFSEKITNDVLIWKDTSIDLIIIVDSSDPYYAGVGTHLRKMNHKPVVVNIDHHETNTEYGDHNLIAVHASSTAEIIFNFFRYNKIRIDKTMATSLLTGIITDTDSFTNSATTISSLSAASELIRVGGDLNLIKKEILKDKSIASLKLWGTVLSRLTLHEKTELVYTYITQNDLRKFSVEQEETEGIANYLNNLSDGKAGLILKETEDKKIKGSLRTTRDDVDLSRVAKNLGGGGHRKAAGFDIDGPIDKALNMVLKAMENENK